MEIRTGGRFCLMMNFLLQLSILIHPSSSFFLKNCSVHGSLSSHPEVNCSNAKFQAVPTALPHQTKALDISFNLISIIKKEDLRQLVNLTTLSVSNNQIRQVEDGAFTGLVSLLELNLAHNRLTRLSDGSFHGLGNLTVLRLDCNFITTIEASAFSPLSNVRAVNLSKNSLRYVEKVQPVFHLPHLQELYVGGNSFSTFRSEEVSNTSLKLKVLDLSRNPLDVFRITTDVLPHLEMLDLAYSGPNGSIEWHVEDRRFFRSVNRLNLSGIHISDIGVAVLLHSFSSLNNLWLFYMREVWMEALLVNACLIPTLRVLHLRRNNLTDLTGNMFANCSLVEVLDLSENSLINRAIEFPFRYIEGLKIVNLAHNDLRHVPNRTRSLLSLEHLNLSFNLISKLSCSDFVNLTQLTHLYLFYNKIESLRACFFKDLKSLKVLKLGTNHILSINDAFKTGLYQLNQLELKSNKISSIRKQDFKSLGSLKFLDLAVNQISKIMDYAFLGLFNLTQLSLGFNKITSKTIIKANVFSGMPKLKVLHLYRNHLSYKNHDALRNPPFSTLKSLTYLTLSNQDLCHMPCNILEGLDSIKKVDVGNTKLNFIHPDTFRHTPQLSVLDISDNVLSSLMPKVFQPVPSLTTLLLTKSSLQSLDFIAQANLTKVQNLFVSRNMLTGVDETLVKSLPALTYLDIQNNTFTCDCSNAWFIGWAESDNDTQVIGASRFACNSPPDQKGTTLVNLDINSCNVDVGLFYLISTSSLVLLTLSASFLYHFLRWQLVYAYYLLLAFLYDRKQRRMCKGFQYDAFVSYSTYDELWVMRELLPQLEGEQGQRLCLHHRDFQLGKPIIDNIVDSIYSSRKTICVISRRYLESEWCSREIQVASFRLFDEQKDVLILVFLEDIPAHQLSPYHRMRRLVKKRTYLRWPKPEGEARVFWQQLRVALETRGSAEEENPILSGVDSERL